MDATYVTTGILSSKFRGRGYDLLFSSFHSVDLSNQPSTLHRTCSVLVHLMGQTFLLLVGLR